MAAATIVGADADPTPSRGDEFPEPAALVALLNGHLPVCKDGRARVQSCTVRERIAGRRGKMFALVDAAVSVDGAAATCRPLVLQRFGSTATTIAEGRKVFRRLRQRARQRAWSSRVRPWAAFVADECLLVLPFPFDYRLPTLVDACDADAVLLRLRECVSTPLTAVTVVPVRYVPEKRCQIRYDVTAFDGTVTRVFGKVAAHDRVDDVLRWMQTLHEALAGSGLVATPAPRGYLPELRLLLQEGAPGETVYALQRAAAVPQHVYARIGEALSSLHHTALAGLPQHTVSDELQLLWAMIDRGRLSAIDRAAALSLVAALAGTSAWHDAAPTVSCHRDFYDKQMLWSEQGLWIIDLDTLALGPRAMDVGNFLAHVRLRERQGVLSAAAAREASAQFLEGYRRGAEIGTAEVTWFVAATLVRLAGVYVVRPAWRHLVTGLLADAAAALMATTSAPGASAWPAWAEPGGARS